MKKVIGIVLIVVFLFAMRRYLMTGLSRDIANSLGQLTPVVVVGLLGLYLIFYKKN